MLFLLFQIGQDRYALEASRVIEVVPMVALKHLPQSPAGVAGVFNYRGCPAPAIDLSQLTLGRPARERLSTRIIIVRWPGDEHPERVLGLVAENATEMLRKEAKDFVDPGIRLHSAPYLGPVLMDAKGVIQWIHEQKLISEPIRQLLHSTAPALQP
jgi:chemotaxis-related protein WspB